MKVDTHIHHSAAMSAKHLLDFILKKMETESETIVEVDPKTKEKLKLREVCDKLRIEKKELSLDALNVQADRAIFQRFDRFNSKYSPLGQPLLRSIFLKTDNCIGGRYMAEITQEMIANIEKVKYVFVEWRVSIYGKHIDEWKKLAQWFQVHRIYSHNVRWLIQIPRL